jgi:predicted outer membrane lipoprotein
MKTNTLLLACAFAASTVLAQNSVEVDDEKAKAAALAKATLNPIASLISLPMQNNFDWGAGPE